MTTKLIIPVLALTFLMPGAVFAADGSFDEKTLTTDIKKPTVTGEAEDVKTVRILIENKEGKDMFRSNKITVKKGEWKTKISKDLPAGTYDITLYGPKGVSKQTLAKDEFVVNPKGVAAGSTIAGGTLNVSSVPLLMGGTASRGASIPVAYVKVSNPGKKVAAITGFRLSETGTAPEDKVVIGFSTSDDKGGSRTTTYTTFKSGYALVPLAATIEPGTFKIFTIKAIMGGADSYYGKKLQIDVAGVGSAGTVNGTFPMKGTTFTLIY